MRVMVMMIMSVVVMMTMPVVMAVIVAVIILPGVDLQVDRADPVSLDTFGCHAVRLLDTQRLQGLEYPVKRGSQVNRGPQEHVPGDPTEWVDMQVLTHRWAS